MPGGRRQILVLFLDTARALISAWPQASPYSGQNLSPNRDRTLAAKTWEHPLSAGRGAWQQGGSCRQGRTEGWRRKGVTRRGLGEGSHGGGGEANEVGILTEFPPGRLWQRLDSPELREVLELPGGREGMFLPVTSQGSAPAIGLGGEGRGQAPAPRASAPPQPRRRGPRRCSMESTFAAGCREQQNLPPAPPEESLGRFLIQRLGARSRGHLGAHRTLAPPPTSQTGTSPGEGLRLGQGRRESETLPPTPIPESSPGPWRAPLTMLELLRTPRALQFLRTDLNPPSTAPVQPRLQAGTAGRQTPGKRGRAAARAGLAREGRAR